MYTTLDNKIRVIVCEIPAMYSVAMGIYAGVGSAQEPHDKAGIAHLCEHMMFKGTKSRNAFEIAEGFERIGSQVNAFTTKEITCFYAKATAQRMEESFEILSDIFLNSQFDKTELQREINVVLEEISMYEDSNEDLCGDLLAKEFFKESQYSRSIIGDAKSVKKIKREDLFDFVENYYSNENIVIVFSGHIKKSQAIELVQKHFGKRKSKESAAIMPAEGSRGRFISKAKPIELANICIGFPSIAFEDKHINEYNLLNTIFGGGMSSRLFQEIREKRGLAYSVYSFISSFKNCGINTIYLGCNPQKVSEAMTATFDLLQEFCQKGVTEIEFSKGIETFKSSLVFGQENTTTLMNAYGKYLLMTGKEFSVKEKLDKINAIDFDNLNKLARNMFDQKQAVISIVANKEVCKNYDKR